MKHTEHKGPPVVPARTTAYLTSLIFQIFQFLPEK